MKILAQDSQVQYFIAQRKIRVYVNRNTDAEERVDFILALAKDYDRYSAECAKQHFPDADAKPKGTSTKPFVLCKKNLMAVYKNKHQKTPEIVIERASYEVASFPGRVLVFRPNNDLPKAKLFSCPERTVTIPDDEQMRKWSFCLKLVGFRSFCDTPPPRFFFPQVIYGFIAEEASELRTDLGRGNLIGGLFGVSPLKGSLQKPKDQELASPASSFAPAAQED
ncbi:2-oxoglutarate e2 dihydrolipoamide succinyltransferase [Cystoisospora suis]|uniref:2-oxoglutarate e2 dihydrolipoamide succinyltransferase n=1 Tax=Cystoisospora suis TaxID=483139 RepID=A0A2C6KYX2_9APIC|nr:2-oxoglutarate e2 dihydrolipoamide succinyltransferase [Cystoisospora suis]